MPAILCPALDALPQGAAVKRILAAALQAVEPGEAVRRHVTRTGNRLQIGGETYDLDTFRRVWLVGAGKAGAPMAAAAAELLGERLSGGAVIVKEGHLGQPGEVPKIVELIEAGHPLPDARGVAGAQRIMALLAENSPDDLIIALISGGGSALMVSPVDGVTLSDLQALTGQLLACGASINEINTLRKHLETLKGGGIARLASPAALVTLVLSDVIGDPLDIIASGPAVPDPSSFADAWGVLERYRLVETIPTAIRNHLRHGLNSEIPDTPKPGDALFDRVRNVLIGNNYQAAQAALRQAQTEGYHTLVLTTSLQGEARQAGRFLAALLRQVAATGEPLPRPACIVAGGETTVTLQGDGLGGRNQELALGALADLAGVPDVALVTLATDGGDGPTDAAGAVVTGDSQQRAQQLGMQPEAFLRRNDAYHFFDTMGELIRTGPTRTNVNDLAFLFALKSPQRHREHRVKRKRE